MMYNCNINSHIKNLISTQINTHTHTSSHIQNFDWTRAFSREVCCVMYILETQRSNIALMNTIEKDPENWFVGKVS